jgi:transposase
MARGDDHRVGVHVALLSSHPDLLFMADAEQSTVDGALLKLPASMAVAVPEDLSCAPNAQQASGPAPLPPCSVAFETRRGRTSVHASLPLDERSAAWLREVLG